MTIYHKFAIATAIALAPATALAVPVTGGETTVRVTAPLASLGLTVGLTGTAQLLDAGTASERVLFPITGGDLDPVTLAGTILHEGSGLTLTGGGQVLGVGNFIIDTTNSLLLGDVTLNGVAFAEDFALFSFDLSSITTAQLLDTANPALSLFVTAGAAGALTQVFGAPDLTGVEFGLAATAPALATGGVPEASTWAMMIAGFGLVGAGLRRRRIASVSA